MKVSVIIPNYNHSSYLEQRIDSVLTQTYQNFEVILLDDCSSDCSKSILSLYKNHPKVSVLYINPVNSGSPFGLWKKGIELAKGELIWIAESDDWAESTFLEIMVPCFINPNIVLAHCKSYLVTFEHQINQFNYWKTMCYTFNPDEVEVDFVNEGKCLLESISSFRGSVVNVSSAVFRKSSAVDIEFPLKYKIFGDWWFWSQLFLKGHIYFISQYLNYIRSHDSSATSRKKSNFSSKYLENIEVAHKVSSLCRRRLAYDPKYSWMIVFWTKEFQKTVNKFAVFFIPFIYLPFSFKVEFLKKLYSMYKNKFFPFLN